ncbi:unnamed protein product [Phytophthora fragariaefolia]|uniref:Unnamed protein product n=1 Tax=Phytophthora fragariaefolia TaxID=1490495 RepID=A0A9W7D660_9STRA|nr:unnamed protein product [Phytophthora fragariaefolia]
MMLSFVARGFTARQRLLFDDHSLSAGAFTMLLENWPYNAVRGFGFEQTYSDLYCFRDSAWLNDDAMKAFAVVLAKYKNNVTITAAPQGHDEAKQKKSGRKGLVSSKALKDVVAGVSTHAFVLLPVNFGVLTGDVSLSTETPNK